MRLFLATTFPPAVLRDLNERVGNVRSRLPAATWVREETQHLTFAFLGEQPEALVARIEPAITATLANLPRFEARLQGSGFFPNPRHARVGWTGLAPEEHFVDIARALREIVTKHGVTLDGDFKAHLTMMRMRDGWPPASIELFNRTLRDYRSEPFTVDTVTLFSSELHPKGAIHTAQRTFSLK